MPRFGKKYYFLPIFFAGWSLACDLHTQHFLLIWIVFSQMSISSTFNQVAKWVPSYSFTYSCISQEWRSWNQFEQSANEIGHHIASLTPSPPKWMRFFPLQQCCKSVESVENTFFFYSLLFEIARQTSQSWAVSAFLLFVFSALSLQLLLGWYIGRESREWSSVELCY